MKSVSDDESLLIKSTSEIDELLFNMYFQIMFTLASIHTHGGIIHEDIKKVNILFNKVEKKGYWIYVINKKKYYIPNLGFVMVINDFGRAKYLYPKEIHKSTNRISKSFWRIEYGKIYKNRFHVEIPSIINTIKNKYNIGSISDIIVDNIVKEYSYNEYKNHLMKNKPEINIEDIKPINYISSKFSLDIIDVIHSFTNGIRTLNNKNHGTMKLYDKSKVFKNTMEKMLKINTNKDLNNIDCDAWKRAEENNLIETGENPIFMCAINNLEYIFKNMYKKPKNKIEILEKYTIENKNNYIL